MSLQLVSTTTKSTPEPNVDQTRLAQLCALFPPDLIPKDLIRIILEYQVPTAMPTLACWQFSHEVIGASIQRDGETDCVLAYHKSATAEDTISVHEGFSNSKTLTVEDSLIFQSLIRRRVYLGMHGERFVVKYSNSGRTNLDCLRYSSSKQMLEKDPSTWAVVHAGRGGVFSVDPVTGMVITTSYRHDKSEGLLPMLKNIPELASQRWIDLAEYNNDTDTFLVATGNKIYSVNLKPPHETTFKCSYVSAATISPYRSTLFVAGTNQVQHFSLPEVRQCGTYPVKCMPCSISASQSTLGVLWELEYGVWDTSYGTSLYQFSLQFDDGEVAVKCEQGEWAALISSVWGFGKDRNSFYLYDTRNPSTKPVLKTTGE